MEPHDEQAAADAAEARTDERYAALQNLMDAFEEPMRRADAMLRLEAWLEQNPPPARVAHRSS